MKKIIVITLLILQTIYLSAEDKKKLNITESISRLLTWITDVDNIILNIDNKEKLKKIERYLSDISSDVDNIHKWYLQIMGMIDKEGHIYSDDLLVDDLKGKLIKLQKSIDNLSYMIDNSSMIGIDKNINYINDTWYAKMRLVSLLYNFNDLDNKNKIEIKKDIKHIIELNRKIKKHIDIMKDKLKEKIYKSL